ncbi:MAG TPA: class I SAM-dependent methyltransferase [candidate division Zixibacteria bacterium]|nr:class I SAM-dependent methyltransferase [candidate division Zixibacteria bacterium]
MFDQLRLIADRPRPYQFYTANQLWADPHISQKMLEYHLDNSVDLASRNKQFVERSVDWLVRECDLKRGAAVCDFGCGPGFYTTLLASRGMKVTGLDFSERSLKYARRIAEEKKLGIDYRQQNYLDFTPDRQYDLVTMIFCDFCVLSPEQRRLLLGIFRQCLKPGGKLVLDVVTMNQFNLTEEKNVFDFYTGEGFWSSQPHFIFQSTFKYPSEQLYVDKWTIIERVRTREIYNWMQCFTPVSLDGELARSGFRSVKKFANVAGDPFDSEATEMAVVAEVIG